MYSPRPHSPASSINLGPGNLYYSNCTCSCAVDEYPKVLRIPCTGAPTYGTTTHHQVLLRVESEQCYSGMQCQRHDDSISQCAASAFQRSMMFRFMAHTCVLLALTDTDREKMRYICKLWTSRGSEASIVTTPTGEHPPGACCEYHIHYHIDLAHHLLLTYIEALTSVVAEHLPGTVPRSPDSAAS